MTALLLAPHCDDETLWASFLCLKYQPRIVVCTMPRVQEAWDVSAVEREVETSQALQILGIDEWTQLQFLDTDAADDLRAGLTEWLAQGVARALLGIDTVIAPAYEDGGQAQHNAVAQAATDVFGSRVIRYLTYTRDGRSKDGTLVDPDEPEWIALKLQALACYRSQLRVPNCRPWFYDQLDIREWLA